MRLQKRGAPYMRDPKYRCTAHKTNGEPCNSYRLAGMTVCNAHGGRAPQVRRAAQKRLDSAALTVVDQLLRICTDDTIDPRDRIAAAKELLSHTREIDHPTSNVKVEVNSAPEQPHYHELLVIARERVAALEARGANNGRVISSFDDVIDVEAVEVDEAQITTIAPAHSDDDG